MLKNSLLLLLVVTMLPITGCTVVNGTKTAARDIMPSTEYLKPRFMRKELFRNIPMGEDSYSQGFRDGCQTFAGVVGASTLRMLPTKIDGNRLTNDPWYLRGYRDASTYCTFILDWEIH